MDDQQPPEPPAVPETTLHKFARGVIMSWLIFGAIGMLLLVVSMCALGFQPAYQFSLPPFTQVSFVFACVVIALAGICYAFWGLLQLLFPFIFSVSTTMNSRNGESITRRVRPMFSVCRRLRFWGSIGILTGLVWSTLWIGLAIAFGVNPEFPDIPIVYGLMGLYFALGMQLLAYADTCPEYRTRRRER